CGAGNIGVARGIHYDGIANVVATPAEESRVEGRRGGSRPQLGDKGINSTFQGWLQGIDHGEIGVTGSSGHVSIGTTIHGDAAADGNSASGTATQVGGIEQACGARLGHIQLTGEKYRESGGVGWLQYARSSRKICGLGASSYEDPSHTAESHSAGDVCAGTRQIRGVQQTATVRLQPASKNVRGTRSPGR